MIMLKDNGIEEKQVVVILPKMEMDLKGRALLW